MAEDPMESEARAGLKWVWVIVGLVVLGVVIWAIVGFRTTTVGPAATNGRITGQGTNGPSSAAPNGGQPMNQAINDNGFAAATAPNGTPVGNGTMAYPGGAAGLNAMANGGAAGTATGAAGAGGTVAGTGGAGAAGAAGASTSGG